MPPSFVQKYILPAIKVRKALKQSNEGNLPGGIETAIMFSLFDDIVMDFTKSTITTRYAPWSIMPNDTLDHCTFMKEGRMGLHRGTVAALRQLENVSKLPRQEELWDMKDPEIDSRNEEIAEAIKQYEAYTWRDHDDLILLREQGSLLANLVSKYKFAS
jgi:hypothetical protein